MDEWGGAPGTPWYPHFRKSPYGSVWVEEWCWVVGNVTMISMMSIEIIMPGNECGKQRLTPRARQRVLIRCKGCTATMIKHDKAAYTAVAIAGNDTSKKNYIYIYIVCPNCRTIPKLLMKSTEFPELFQTCWPNSSLLQGMFLHQHGDKQSADTYQERIRNISKLRTRV